MTKRLLIVGDLHVGSGSGLILPGYVIESHSPIDGMQVYGNEVQKTLYAAWELMIDQVGRVDAVLANGDLVEGPNHRDRGHGVWATEIEVQAQIAATLLSMVKAKKYYITAGTGYHTGKNPNGDRMVYNFLPGKEGKHRVFGRKLAINLEDIRIHAKHPTSSSTVPYGRATPLAKAAIWQALLEDDLGRFDLIVRNHRHKYDEYRMYGRVAVGGPCWKWVDDFGDEKTDDLPDLGYLVVEAKGKDFSLSNHLFRLPREHTIKEVTV